MIPDTMARIIAPRVESLRRARGLSQRALAEAAGITRQAVGAIESGRMQPSVRIALGLARALGASVEELFGPVEPGGPPAARSASATIAGKTVTYALDRDHLAIEPGESGVPTVFLAGCDLAVGLLSRHVALRRADLRVLWLAMTNREAMSALAQGRVHAAVVHGSRPRGDEAFARYELATTEEGWLLARGNPLRIRSARDLVPARVRVVNRPAGAAARSLLDEQLRRAQVDPARVNGYAHAVPGQLDAARAVAQDFADAAVGMASVARLFELDFIALREERCTLVLPQHTAATHEGKALVETLRSAPYRRDLESLQSYDTTRTGESIA